MRKVAEILKIGTFKDGVISGFWFDGKNQIDMPDATPKQSSGSAHIGLYVNDKPVYVKYFCGYTISELISYAKGKSFPPKGKKPLFSVLPK